MKLWLINKKSNIFFGYVVFVDKSMLALLVLDFDQESNFSRDFDFLYIVLLSKVMTKKILDVSEIVNLQGLGNFINRMFFDNRI